MQNLVAVGVASIVFAGACTIDDRIVGVGAAGTAVASDPGGGTTSSRGHPGTGGTTSSRGDPDAGGTTSSGGDADTDGSAGTAASTPAADAGSSTPSVVGSASAGSAAGSSGAGGTPDVDDEGGGPGDGGEGGAAGTDGSTGPGGSEDEAPTGVAFPDAGDNTVVLTPAQQIAVDLCAKYDQVDVCETAAGCVETLTASIEFVSTGDLAECENETFAYLQCQAGAPLTDFECSVKEPYGPQYVFGSETCAEVEEAWFAALSADPQCAD